MERGGGGGTNTGITLCSVAGRGAGLVSASRAGTDGPISTIIHISAGGLGSQSPGTGAEGVLAVRASAVDGPQQWMLQRW
jgi:hypothetical protein